MSPEDYEKMHELINADKSRPTVDDLSVGDVILYDGKRREVEQIDEKRISLRNLDAPTYGGILLGTGGLTRAYTKSAQIAVRAAGIVQRRLCLDFELAVSYSDYQKLAPLLARFEAVAEQTDYAAQVTLRGFLPVFLRQEFSAALTDFSRGSARLSFGDERYATVAQPQDRPL